MTVIPKQSKSGIRLRFFELLFGDEEGYICLGVSHPDAPNASFKQRFFNWPNQFQEVENYILKAETAHNIYFCVNLFSRMTRQKEFCLDSKLLWADLDEIDPDGIEIPPAIVIESSPGRWQALWRLTTKMPALQAEDYSKRLAYSVGADKSGWDLTQLLRVPLTRNFKYPDHPHVNLPRALETAAPPLLFEALPVVDITEVPSQDMPADVELPDVESIMYKWTAQLRGTAFQALYTQELEEDADWSGQLWRLMHICLEAGMTQEEVFAIAKSAPCNKYERDGRPLMHLWRDVLKAHKAQVNIFFAIGGYQPLIMPNLVHEPASETFIDQYRDWATEATDAVEVFHDLSCTIMLSAIISNSVKLEASHGLVTPNLWGMILGDSTLTRKTTAMRMAMDFLTVMDSEMVIGTEGSPEGLLTGLEQRPNKVSIFFKDEVSGFFDSINRKDYLAGMPEILTALYDVPTLFIRRLRKGTITIESPAFIFFGGGVPNRVYENITDEFVISGFLPRFLVVSGETTLARLRRTGPPNSVGVGKRAALANYVMDLFESYAVEVDTRIGGQVTKMTPRYMAELTDDAWEKYGEIEEILVSHASESSIPDLALPTFERLSRSILKMGVVLGASRQKPNKDGKVEITDNDITNAAWHVQDWGRFSCEMIANAGKRTSEKLLDKIISLIDKKPGVLRSDLSRHMRLTRREMDEVLLTLEDRMLVRKEQQGRGWRYYLT